MLRRFRTHFVSSLKHMAKIRCHTNIDCAKPLKWPDSLPDYPQVGDLIRSESSTNDKYIELQVVGRTWYKSVDYTTSRHGDEIKIEGVDSHWILHVELHLPKYRFENITAFEQFVLGRKYST